jgi:hypothetical protein
MRAATTLLLALTVTVACNQKQQQVSTNAPPAANRASAMTLSPEQLGELGAQIQKTPDKANELLAHHGMTPESFEAAIRRITEDPDASRRYAAAYRRARA